MKHHHKHEHPFGGMQNPMIEKTTNMATGVVGVGLVDTMTATMPGTTGVVARASGPLMGLGLLEMAAEPPKRRR